jgi:hypothetical protein
MSELDRQVARQIVCDAFNHFTDIDLEPTAEGESVVIQKTLQGLDIKFLIAIHDQIVSAVKEAGCDSSLGVSGFATARYKTVKSVVNDLIASTNCP